MKEGLIAFSIPILCLVICLIGMVYREEASMDVTAINSLGFGTNIFLTVVHCLGFGAGILLYIWIRDHIK